jgi:hypothetical protein
LSGDFAAAAKWLRRGIRDAPETEQKTLIEVAEKDPTLKTLREAQSGMVDKLKRESERKTTPPQPTDRRATRSTSAAMSRTGSRTVAGLFRG